MLAILAIVAALALGVGLPALLSQGADTTVDMERLNAIRFPILGGGFGLGIFFLCLSFFSKGKEQ